MSKSIKSKKKTSAKTTETPFWKVGAGYFIRTVTYHYTGECVDITDKEIILRRAAWIADSGRFTQAMATLQFNEVEVYPAESRVAISRGAIVDAVVMPIDKLPEVQK